MKPSETTEHISLIQRRFRTLRPHLTERQRRMFAATEAKALGHGGVTLVARATGMSRTTIHQGLTELRRRKAVSEAVPSRRPGGGRKNIAVFDPDILPLLERLIDISCGHEPSQPLRWSCRSTRDLADELSRMGHPVSHASISQLLRILGYRIRGNGRAREEGTCREREEQFQRVQKRIDSALRAGHPVIRCRLEAEIQDIHNSPYPSPFHPPAPSDWKETTPDPQAITRAAQHLCRWWRDLPESDRKGIERLVVCADARGCDRPHIELWREELQRFATESQREVEVLHLPPGASRWESIQNEEEFRATDRNGERALRVRISIGTVAAPPGFLSSSPDSASDSPSEPNRWSYTLKP